MSPARGGEADKFGNRYEGRWTVAAMLRVLVGHATSIVIEERGEPGAGVEFALNGPNRVEAHQVKRQRGNRNGWTLRDLRNEGVLAAATAQIQRGRAFWFVSVVPCRDLDELATTAQTSDDPVTFVENLTEELGAKFAFLAAEWGGVDEAFAFLQNTHALWPDERHLVHTNAALSETMLTGAHGRTAATALADVAWDNLGKTLDAETIERALADYGLRRAQLATPSTHLAIESTFRSWATSVGDELLAPAIARSEAKEVVQRLRAGASSVLLVSGAAGEGKSAVLHEAVTELADGWPVLAMRLDQIEAFSSTHELGVSRLGLPCSPAAALASIAEGRDCLLVVDQLDAVSLASGRMPTTFQHVADLIREAKAFPGMRVLLACRQFDIDNDHRLRDLVGERGLADQLGVAPLTDAQVTAAVAGMGLAPDTLTKQQKALLRTPLHLVLLKAVAGESTALTFTSAKDLMDAFYDQKRRACDIRAGMRIRFGDTAKTLVENMSGNQRLYAALAALDERDLHKDADVMSSEHVLVRDGTRLRFFHEAFFDYAFARSWLLGDESLLEFLLASEQELFRRAQVRQVLVHLRAEEPGRFLTEVGSLLSHPDIRFHIKDVVIALLRALETPTSADWQLVKRCISDEPRYVERLWSMLRTPGWFDRLNAEGELLTWLSDGGERFGRAVDVMVTVGRERPEHVAALLNELGDGPRHGAALRAVSFYTDLHESRAMTELVIDGVRRGLFDADTRHLFMSAHGLGSDEPLWACELLQAWFVERPDPLALAADGHVLALADSDHGAVEMIGDAAGSASTAFATFAIPYLLRVMAATSSGEPRPFSDAHFGYRIFKQAHHDVDDALLLGARDALRAAITSGDHAEVRPLLEQLATDPHDAAQWLLYEALAADGVAYADWMVELLTQGDHRLHSGYSGNPFWTTRQMVIAASPHLSDPQVATLEQLFLRLRPRWEDRPRGLSSWTLLTALPEQRLSATGRRRRQELSRIFGEEPPPPMGIMVGSIGAPIPQPKAAKMSDEQWLRAIAKHGDDRTDYEHWTGGAPSQAMVLGEEAQADPARFAALALRFSETTHPAYSNAVLYALGSAEGVEPQKAFTVMRHIAQWGIAENDRALVDVPRRFAPDVPDDIVQLLLDRAMKSPDPNHEAWQAESHSGGRYYSGDPYANGINTARGAAAYALGDLLISDRDGRLTALVAPSFETLAADPSVAVRTCVAHLFAAGLRHARSEVVSAFSTLIEADDELLGSRPAQSLIVYLGFGDNALVKPVIERMLASPIEQTREVGGHLAAFGTLELNLDDLLDQAQSGDAIVRRGAAGTCAHRLPITSEVDSTEAALRHFFSDEDAKVRDTAAEVAAALRHKPLAKHERLLEDLIHSPAFPDAVPQLLITLDHATEPVDRLVLLAAKRFLDQYSGQLKGVSTLAAADSKEVGELVLRAYAQASDARGRGQALDLIDELLAEDAYRFSRLLDEAER
ncbi:MAG: hypothetical protein WBD40_09560 [Tepidisphaeraceae bacterium]